MKPSHELELISACDSIEDLTDALISIAKKYGFQTVLFGLKITKASKYDDALISTNYPTAWRTLYQHDRLHLVDPTVNHALNYLRPLLWSQSIFRTKDERMLYEQAASFGLKTGVTLPIHGARGEFGLLSFASDSDLPQTDMLSCLSALALTRDLSVERCLGLIPLEARTLLRSPLTPRESECLKWLTNGKTSWEISKILTCSEATVNFHVSNILKKLGVLNRQQAVVKSLLEGWVVI